MRSYPIYNDIWKVNVEEQLPYQCENGNCADLFRWLSFAINERHWPHLFAHVSVFTSPYTSSSTHARQLKKEDHVGQGPFQQKAGSDIGLNLSGSIFIGEKFWYKKKRKLVFHECYMIYCGNLC